MSQDLLWMFAANMMAAALGALAGYSLDERHKK